MITFDLEDFPAISFEARRVFEVNYDTFFTASLRQSRQDFTIFLAILSLKMRLKNGQNRPEKLRNGKKKLAQFGQKSPEIHW